MRRIVLALALAAVATTVWLVAPAMSRAPYVPQARDFAMAIPASAVGPAGGGAHASAVGRLGVLSPVMRAPKRFDLIGFRWRSPVQDTIRVRTRDHGGRWSNWVELGTTDSAPDHRGGPRTSEPVWVGGADEFQLRSARKVRGLAAHFVNVTGTATPLDRVATAARRAAHNVVAAVLGAPPLAQAAGNGGRPPIITRAEWGASQCKPRAKPEYGQVKMAFIHHTVNANDYSPSDSAGIVLAICRFHRDTNGWNDIGYNFLVDRYGQIFEGRAGGVDRAVLGAQVQGLNSESTGVALLGDFMDVKAPEVALRSVARLLAWKLTLHGVPPTGMATVTGQGGSQSRFRAGQTVRLAHISGHRDGGLSDCPGNALYAQLPHLRTLTAALVASGDFAAVGEGNASLSLTVGARHVVFPTRVRISGKLTFGDGADASRVPLELQRREARSSTVHTSTITTGSDGIWKTTLLADSSTTFKVAYAGSDDEPPVTSRAVGVSIIPRIRVRLSRKTAQAGGIVSLRGTVAPRKPRLEVVIQRQAGKRYRFLGRQPVTVVKGRYLAPIHIGTARRYRMRVRFLSDGVNPYATTRWLTVQGTPAPRGAKKRTPPPAVKHPPAKDPGGDGGVGTTGGSGASGGSGGAGTSGGSDPSGGSGGGVVAQAG